MEDAFDAFIQEHTNTLMDSQLYTEDVVQDNVEHGNLNSSPSLVVSSLVINNQILNRLMFLEKELKNLNMNQKEIILNNRSLRNEINSLTSQNKKLLEHVHWLKVDTNNINQYSRREKLLEHVH